ncbi:pentatricopeptide repeat-containing protein At4g39530-like [Selaginella moellendorffii]|uniref:pentatricopeptide repeat-containing protein At4g39530-like n=1 Tax=Selaginella moellendorffii TaxID=88036 RepID=UPI000D1C6D08|nr:pentatricopeptide repeat-containing protein At4g39530-like [Selaginella moellendorffii]|eukprot:XP_024536087.1 pentatricopeptide repeat-containing protein At4g39530-like [Selaginella moellendorffii]
MYIKCGSLEESRRVFEGIKHPDKVSWTSLMAGYVENKQEEMALELLARMEARDMEADAVTFVTALNACGSLAAREERTLAGDGSFVRWRALERGRDVHARAASLGFDCDVRVRNSLIDMYGKCGSMVDSRRVFDGMPCHSLASWTSLMLGYTDSGQGELALALFDQMRNFQPDKLVFVAALKALTSVAAREQAREADGKLVKIASLEKARVIHSQASSLCYDSDLFVASRLVDVYAKCGSLEEARQVFDSAPRRDVVLWTSLILGYTEKGLEETSLSLFFRMQDEGCSADTPSFLAALAACASLAMKEAGRKIDGKLVKLQSLENAMLVHSRALEARLDTETFLANTLVDVYAKCGSVLDDARLVFDTMPCHNVVSWTALLLGYAENGEFSLALELFSVMRLEMREWEPGAQTFVAALKSCGSLAALAPIHGDICRCGMENNGILANSLMDVYGKCGSMLHTLQIFESLASKDVVAWNTIIAGSSRQGDTNDVFHLFASMLDEGCKPDAITFVCLLTACSHGGLVARGKLYFERMTREFGLAPGIDHYTCLIDLLGRANELDAAIQILRIMPVRASPAAWKSLMSSCRKWGSSGVGKLAFEALVEMGDGGDASAYSLMANIYQGSTG